MKKKTLQTILMIALFPIINHSKEIAVNTKLLYAVTTTPNLVVGWTPLQKLPVDLPGSFNRWYFDHSDPTFYLPYLLINGKQKERHYKRKKKRGTQTLSSK